MTEIASITPRPASAADTLFAGRGEMAALCRAMDWSATPLGPVEGWSIALRTTVATVLGTRNPMFLFWGPEHVQIYNDAYRPSLGASAGDGSSRHPRALGMRGHEFWTDIWDAIGPQVEQVMTTGEATWHEDQYLPIERNGGIEDVWWTYSYSPVRDDDGSINGTLVVCMETTTRVLGTRERERLLADTARAERRAERILERVGDRHVAADAHFRIVAANSATERATGMPRASLVGLTLWEAFPGIAGTGAEEEYRRVVREGTESHFTAQLATGRHLEIDAYPTDEGGIALFWRDVSERVHAEQARREGEARLRAIYDGTYEYIGLIAPDGTVLECNRASLEFAGNRREEVVGLPMWETPWFIHTPGAAELLRESVARAAAGEFIRYVAPLRRPSGETLVFDFSLHPIRDARGEVIYIVPEGRDITEPQRTAEALRESEARYRLLFDSLDEGFCVIDVLFDDEGTPVDYHFVEANPAFVAQTGLHDVIGRRMREMVPDHEPQWFETYGRVAVTGEPMRFDAGAAALGRWYDVYAFRLGEASDHRVAVLFRDVSAARAAARERERLLAALEVERSRLAEVFRRAPSFLAVLRGPELRYEFVNEAYMQLVGHRGGVVGLPLRDVLPELDAQGFIRLLDRVLATGEPWVGNATPTILHRTPGAPPETRYLDMVFQALTEADGTRSGVAVHGSDVTEQVLARREVERLLAESEGARAEAEGARAEAEAANRAKSEFLAVMSHELRTPLNAIGGYTELVEMGIYGPVTPAQLQALGRIQLSQRHLLGLINEVLNYAKLETGTVHFDVEDVPLREALTAAELLVAPQARAKGLSLVVAECAPPFQVRADAEKLRQILVNLLSNSVKFTDPGGRIGVECELHDGLVRVSVHDTGIGIPADRLEAIFDPFVQVRSDLTRPHEGTGLGLAISRELARAMGGDLTARSVEGEGSVFTVTLPVP